MASMRVDADGVRIVQHGGARRVVALGIAAIALVLLVTAAVVTLLDRGAAAPGAPATPTAVAPAPATVTPAPSAAVAAAPRDVRPRRKRSERKAAAAAKEGEALDARDVIPMLQAAGEREGIAAFPVPGTDPPKTGLIVPEDFALPEGYVRHFQATDDGERLPPILMFHPDYEFVDAAGNAVALPGDGVVPPELAPPGLPLETLELPDRRP
jgi:hypothetical protein